MAISVGVSQFWNSLLLKALLGTCSDTFLASDEYILNDFTWISFMLHLQKCCCLQMTLIY